LRRFEILTARSSALFSVAVPILHSPALARCARVLCSIACCLPLLAFGQQQPDPAKAPPPAACPLEPAYPLPADRQALEQLAERQREVSGERACLKDAHFHAWRGATLLALGRPVEAIEPLERALLQDPDLSGAQLDLAQALAQEGDTASARSFLSAMRRRPDLPLPIGSAIDRQLDLLSLPSQIAGALTQDWQYRLQMSALAGADSNLNNGPAASEITLTFPQGRVTLPLADNSQARGGGGLMGAVQWQGLRVHGDSLWVLQAELRGRETSRSDTNYQQADLAATWLQAPAAPRQWVVRLAATDLHYGGSNLVEATRATLQYQWEALDHGDGSGGWPAVLGGCRPSASVELEHRRYPTSTVLNGLYEGGAFGWLCRRSSEQRATEALTTNTSFYSLQARLGTEHPLQSERPGGSYQRAEIRAQWEGPLLSKGRLGVLWVTTRQNDRESYSALLGNVARHTLRHGLELEASWPLTRAISFVTNAEVARQTSNLAVFESHQRSLYMGLRWEMTR
jgi:tetratricopeptide (TPR) repeat protein